MNNTLLHFLVRMVSGGNLSVPPADMQKYWTNGVERFYGFKVCIG